MYKPKFAIHRGGNSWPNIKQAIMSGYDFVELDVHLSLDDVLIVQYESEIIIGEEYIPIANLNYFERSPKEQQNILLLKDILAFAKGKIGIIIDIKKGKQYYPEIGKRVATVISEYGDVDNTWVISFDHQCLLEVKMKNQSIKIAPMYVARLVYEEKYFAQLLADGVEVCLDYLDENTVKLVHSRGLYLIGWCASDSNDLQKLLKFKTDIVTINWNDRILLSNIDENYN